MDSALRDQAEFVQRKEFLQGICQWLQVRYPDSGVEYQLSADMLTCTFTGMPGETQRERARPRPKVLIDFQKAGLARVSAYPASSLVVNHLHHAEEVERFLVRNNPVGTVIRVYMDCDTVPTSGVFTMEFNHVELDFSGDGVKTNTIQATLPIQHISMGCVVIRTLLRLERDATDEDDPPTPSIHFSGEGA